MKPKVALCLNVFLVVSLSILSTGCSAGSGWKKRVNLPTGLLAVSASAVNGKIYVIGGYEGDRDQWVGSKKVEVYSLTFNFWTSKPEMLTARGSLISEVVEGKIYLMGGSPGTAFPPVASVEAFDPKTNSWTRLADMPEATDGATASQVSGKIYVFGGTQYQPLTQERLSIPTVEAYDPATDSWTKRTDMQTGRYALSSAVVDGKIYIIGGLISTFQMVTPAFATQSVEVYDPQADTWSKKADLPAPKAYAAVAALNGKIYVFGGVGSDDAEATSSVFVYDVQSDTWATLPAMPFRRQGMSACVVNGRIYILGGSSHPLFSGSPDPEVWEFKPGSQ